MAIVSKDIPHAAAAGVKSESGAAPCAAAWLGAQHASGTMKLPPAQAAPELGGCLRAHNARPGARRRRLWRVGLAVCGVMVLCGPTGPGRLQGQPADRSGVAAEEPGAALPAEHRGKNERVEVLREGTQLSDASGHFKLSGSRVVFVLADGSRRFTVLENLNLERIAQMARDDAQRVAWTVSGLVTEYQGTNYLLIRRARRRSLPPRRPAVQDEAEGAASGSAAGPGALVGTPMGGQAGSAAER